MMQKVSKKNSRLAYYPDKLLLLNALKAIIKEVKNQKKYYKLQEVKIKNQK